MNMPEERKRSTGAPLLEVDGLSVDFAVDNFWVPAAKKLTYSVRPGEALAIVGESGSGKSVSSMSLLGLLPKNARVTGSARLDGREILSLKGDELRRIRGREIAVIFQEPMTALNPVFTVGFQIIETLRMHFGMTPSAAKARALELLDLVPPGPMDEFIAENELLDPTSPDAMFEGLTERGLRKSWHRGRDWMKRHRLFRRRKG